MTRTMKNDRYAGSIGDGGRLHDGDAVTYTQIIGAVADVQGQLRNLGVFRAHVAAGALSHHGEDGPVLVIYAQNAGPFALLDAAGAVFGEADVLDGCESCGFDSMVGITLDRVEAVIRRAS